MSLNCYNAVWRATGITDLYHLAALLALADSADDDGNVWPEKTEIMAVKARQGVRKFQYVLQELQTENIISVEERRGRGNLNRVKINLHTLHLLSCGKPVDKSEKRCTEGPEKVHGEAVKGARYNDRAREKLLKAPKGFGGEERPSQNPVEQVKGKKPERPAETIARERADAAWVDLQAALKDHLAGKKLVVLDPVSRDFIQSLGKDKAMMAFARGPDEFAVMFKRAYAKADIDNWKRNKGPT